MISNARPITAAGEGHRVTERPILFSAPMVKAILAGEKTQTRRVMSPQPVRSLPHTRAMRNTPNWTVHHPMGWRWRNSFVADDAGGLPALKHSCPYGVPSQRLWVRETWSPVERECDSVDGIRFAADGAFVPIENTSKAADLWVVAANNDHSGRWRPSIFMPRWASRITLVITDVRVERLQAITEEDARAEGVDGNKPIAGTINGEPGSIHCFGPDASRKAFALLWDAINGERAPWASDPYVWAISFRRIRP